MNWVNKIQILTVSLLLFISTIGSAQTWTKRPFGTTAANFGYMEYLPPTYSTNGPKFPIIVFWHGYGERGNGSSSGLDKIGGAGLPKLIRRGQWPVNDPTTGQPPKEEFVIIAPQSGGFPNFLLMDQFIDYLVGAYNVDPDRVYFTGLSAGGITIFNYLNQYSEKVAAAVPIAGNGIQIASTACGFKHVPLWAFHGNADGTVTYFGSTATVEALNECVPAPDPLARVTIYEGVGHNSWDRTYNLSGMNNFSSAYDPYDINIYDWMLQFRRGGATVSAGPDINLTLPTNSIVLRGTASAPSGSIVSYQWSKTSGPAATLTNATTPNLSLSNLVEGTYIFELTVVDNNGGTASDQARVIVSPAAVNEVPVANAGADRTITLPVNSLNLAGSGSDTDGSIVEYRWTQQTGPSSAALTNANTATVSVSNLVEGEYVFRLTVTDNDGATDFDGVRVTVLPEVVNTPPLANAGADVEITLPTNSVNLVGSGTDTDGSIASYNWVKESGPSVTLANQNNSTLTASNLVEGIYVFRLTVTDDDGDSDNDEVTVTVTAANQIPVADAGPDQNITLPDNDVMLSGSASDVDGSITAYQWSQLNGPNTAFLQNQTTTTLTASNMVEGTYRFQLQVTDDDGATNIDEVSVTVNAAPVNELPVANAGPDVTVTLPQASLVINGFATDPDGSIASYSWTKISGPAVTLADANTSRLTVSNFMAGTYVFRLTVTDNSGDTDIDDMSLNVLPEVVNQPPSVNAGSGQVIKLPTNSITFNGTASDPDGTIVTLLWNQEAGPTTATLANETTTSLTASDLVEGTYTFKLTATDDDGADNSDLVTVVVQVNNLPTANAGPNRIITLPITELALNGSGDDSDGVILSYSWVQISGSTNPALVDDDQATVLVQGGNLQEGQYEFQLTVTDNDGGQGSDIVRVTVNSAPVNEPPTANAGPDVEADLPQTTVDIFGSGVDPDGSIASYEWTQISGSALTLSNTNQATLSASGLVAGTFTFRLMVTDNEGGSDTDEMTLTVNPESSNTNPVADAGANVTITLPVSTAILEGSGTDSDGAIVSYSWSKVSGGNATLSNTDNATLTVTDLQEGNYIFRLQVTDDNGATDTDDVTVTVLPDVVNQTPSANAGPDIVLTLPTNSTLVEGGGTDADGAIIAYEWIQNSGPVPGNISGANSATLSLSGLTEGTYNFTLIVTDNLGATSDDDVLITVNGVNVNQPPVANAGSDVTISLPTNTILLNGSGSDNDGTVTTYAWIKRSGGNATLTNTDLPSLSVSNLEEGSYTFQLTVTDNDGATSTDEVRVIVLPESINLAPVADAGPDQVIILPETTVDLFGSGSDPDGDITNYTWRQVSGPPVNIVDDTRPQLSIEGLSEGEFVFRLTVTDDDGATDFDDATVRVVPENTNIPPLADAGSDQTLALPNNTTTLISNSFDQDGSIISVFWQKVSGPSVTLTGASQDTVTLTNLEEGRYEFSITVTDDQGLTATDNVVVNVLPVSTNVPPVADAGMDQFIELPDNSTTLMGEGTDSDGSVIGFQWTQVSGPNATLGPLDQDELSISNMTAGTYVFDFQVEDNEGATATDQVIIIVNEEQPMAPPVIELDENLEVELPPDTITINAIATDPDGVVVSGRWEQIAGPDAMLINQDSSTLTVGGLILGIYRFSYTAFDNDSLSTTETIRVEVSGERGVSGSEFFSPNNDGVNDFWVLREDPAQVANCLLIIFDRYGNKVFEARNYQNDWDGRLNGNELKEGVYHYVLRCGDSDDNTETGSITLIR